MECLKLTSIITAWRRTPSVPATVESPFVVWWCKSFSKRIFDDAEVLIFKKSFERPYSPTQNGSVSIISKIVLKHVGYCFQFSLNMKKWIYQKSGRITSDNVLSFKCPLWLILTGISSTCSIGLALTIGVIVIFTVDTGPAEVIPDETRHVELSPSPSPSPDTTGILTWKSDMSNRRRHWMRPELPERPMRPRPTRAPRPAVPAVPPVDGNFTNFNVFIGRYHSKFLHVYWLLNR